MCSKLLCFSIGLGLGLAGCTQRSEVGGFQQSDAGDGSAPVEVAPSRARLGLGWGSGCVIDSQGAVKCWGDNGIGQLGVGDLDLTGSAQPLPALGLGSGARAVFGGRVSQCAVLESGRATCWGGALFFKVPFADAATPVYAYLHEPREVDDLQLVASMGLGLWFHCALNEQGGVKCYGYNSEGQLGNGTLEDALSPIDVTGLPPAKDLCAAQHFACAVTIEGSVYCWGENEHGQLGDGTLKAALAPVKVQGLPPGASSVTCGWLHGCAIVDGSVHCWGRNQHGQLGADPGPDALAPVTVPGLTSIVELSSGAFHSCARSSTGQVWCWGTAESGSSPDGPMLHAEGAIELESGTFHSCALLEGERLRCWTGEDTAALGPFGGEGAPI